MRPGLYTNYLIKSSQQPNWVGEIILQMMKWDLEKPNSCLKATELINGGSKAIPFSCSHFLISVLLWDTVNVPHWKIYNPYHWKPLLYTHDSQPRSTEGHIILVAIAECCLPSCWSVCVSTTGTLWAKAPVPRRICLKKWSQNLYKLIVFLIFPIKENACRSTGAQSDLLSRASELSSKKENIALCTALGMV